MANLVTKTRAEMIDEALNWLYQAQERPRPVRVGSNPLGDKLDTTLTFNDADIDMIHETSVLELGQELMLVTAKTSDTTPVVTVSRGYAGTTAIEGAALNDELLLSPTYQRQKISENVDRYFQGPATTWLPRKISDTFFRTSDKRYVELPADTMKVLSVRYLHPTTGRIIDLDDGYRYWDDMPTSVITSGKALSVSALVADTDQLIIVTQEPYAWVEEDPATDTNETDTMSMPVGSDDLPSLYAAAYISLGRELQRSEIDTIEEWNQDEVIRTGTNLRLIAQLWQTFYRRLDEARRVHPVPRRREYRARVKVNG